MAILALPGFMQTLKGLIYLYTGKQRSRLQACDLSASVAGEQQEGMIVCEDATASRVENDNRLVERIGQDAEGVTKGVRL